MNWKKTASVAVTLLILGGFSSAVRAQLVDGDMSATSENQTTTSSSQEVQTAPAATAATPGKNGETTDNGDAIAQLMEKLTKVTDELKACSDMKERVMRLRCYDDLSTTMGLMPEGFKALERQKLASYGFWQVLSEHDQLGIETIYLSQSPYNRLSSMAQQVNVPSLNIRCRQGNTDVYLDWKAVMNGGKLYLKEIFIFSRTDSDQDIRYSWQFSMDGMAAFAADPIEFVKSLRGKRKLQLRVTPYGGNTETLMFEIYMLDEALDILVKRCYADGSDQEPPARVKNGQ